MQTYLHLDILTLITRNRVFRAAIMYEHIENKLAAISLTHLSPTLVEPIKPKEISLK